MEWGRKFGNSWSGLGFRSSFPLSSPCPIFSWRHRDLNPAGLFFRMAGILSPAGLFPRNSGLEKALLVLIGLHPAGTFPFSRLLELFHGNFGFLPLQCKVLKFLLSSESPLCELGTEERTKPRFPNHGIADIPISHPQPSTGCSQHGFEERL